MSVTNDVLPLGFACLLSARELYIWERFMHKLASDVKTPIPPPMRSSGGLVVKLLACGARGPGFDSRCRRYDFRDWLSHVSKVPSRDMTEISLKRCKSPKQPTNPSPMKNMVFKC